MRALETGCKINFVDTNDVYVGFDYGQSCCEQFGYFYTKTEPTAKECHESYCTDRGDSSITKLELEPYNFVTNYYEFYEDDYGGGFAVFKMTTGTNDIYLVLFNHHNGYYSHGFEMGLGIGGEIVRQGSL